MMARYEIYVHGDCEQRHREVRQHKRGRGARMTREERVRGETEVVRIDDQYSVEVENDAASIW